MSPAAGFLILFANLIFWVGLFFAVRWFMRNRREHFEQLGHIADPQTRNGFLFEFRRVTEPTGNNNQVIEYVEYSVALPGPLRTLSMVDAEAREFRTKQVYPREEIELFGAPQTPDDAFDGVFDFTQPPAAEVQAALQDPETRRFLMDLRRIYGRGVWVDHGTLRLLELGRPDDQDIDITLEHLTGELEMLRDRLGVDAATRPDEETVLALDQESSPAEQSVPQGTGGDDWA